MFTVGASRTRHPRARASSPSSSPTSPDQVGIPGSAERGPARHAASSVCASGPGKRRPPGAVGSVGHTQRTGSRAAPRRGSVHRSSPGGERRLLVYCQPGDESSDIRVTIPRPSSVRFVVCGHLRLVSPSPPSGRASSRGASLARSRGLGGMGATGPHPLTRQLLVRRPIRSSCDDPVKIRRSTTPALVVEAAPSRGQPGHHGRRSARPPPASPCEGPQMHLVGV